MGASWAFAPSRLLHDPPPKKEVSCRILPLKNEAKRVEVIWINPPAVENQIQLTILRPLLQFARQIPRKDSPYFWNNVYPYVTGKFHERNLLITLTSLRINWKETQRIATSYLFNCSQWDAEKEVLDILGELYQKISHWERKCRN